MWACPRPCSSATHSSRSSSARWPEAAQGRGSTALIAGEAGIGKTSLVRALVERLGAEARVLMAACDDLVASRTLGPLHDAAVGSGGPLAAALADEGPVDRVFAALLEELAEERPTVLVVEDVHWADDATLDVLGYAARRVEAVGAVLVLTTRDELDPRHPLHRLLGALTGCPVHRIELAPLSRDAVQALAAGTGPRRGRRPRADARQPVLRHRDARRAARRGARPASRTRCSPGCAGSTPDCREALERLSVVPSHVPPELAAVLLGETMRALPAAELAGVIEDRPDGLGFRHELARRAIEGSLPRDPRAAAQPGRRRGAARAGSPRARAPDAPRGRGRRRRHRPRGRPAGRARGRPGRRAPPGAGAPRGGRALRARGWRPPSRPRCSTTTAGSSTTPLASARRCAPAAPRRSSTPASATRSPWGCAWCACRATGSWPGRPTRPRTAPRARCGSSRRRATTRRWPRPRSTRARSSPWPTIPSRPGPCCAGPAQLARASQRMDLAVLCLNYIGIARVESGDPEGLEQVRESIDAGRRRAPSRGGRARLHQPGRAAAARRAPGRARALRGRRPGLHPRARVLVARLQPRGAPLPAAAAPRRLGRRRGGAARGRGRGRRPRDALRLQRAVARAPARPPRRPGRRGHARGGVGAGPAPPPAARPGLRGDRARRVGVAGRGARGRRAGGGGPAGRAPSIRARRPSAASCCATSPAPGCRRSPSRAARPPGRPGWRATGARPPRPGGRPATRTRRPWSWRSPATPRPPPRRCACSRTCAPSRRRRACASACGRWARACRAARARSRAPTRPA